MWILSPAFDGLAGACIRPKTAKRTKLFYHITLSKDFVITLGSIFMVVVSQIGLMNTCWCRASLVFRRNMSTACIDLGPVTPHQREDNWYLWLIPPAIGLLFMLGDIFWAGYQGENGRMLFQRTGPERIAEDKAFKNMEALLDARTTRQSRDSPTPAGLSRAYFDRDCDGSPGPRNESSDAFRLRGRSSGSLGLASPGTVETQHLLSPSATSSRRQSPGRHSRDPSASSSYFVRGATGI